MAWPWRLCGPDDVKGEAEQGRIPVGRSLNVEALFARPWYGDLMRAARTLAPERPEAAVVMAQMSVEAFVEVALSALRRSEGASDDEIDVEMDLLPSFNFRRRETRELWSQLTGDKIQQAPAWSKYVEAVKFRNRVVHRGARATPAEASNAVESYTALIQHMQEVLRAILQSPAE